MHRSFGDAAGRQFGITSWWCWADLEAACRLGWEPSTKFLWFSVHREDAYPIIVSSPDLHAILVPFVTVLNCRNPHVRSTSLIFEDSVIQIWMLRFTLCFHYIRGDHDGCVLLFMSLSDSERKSLYFFWVLSLKIRCRPITSHALSQHYSHPSA